eukprot:jgi/Mesvir1/18830/Mv11431-RA.1
MQHSSEPPASSEAASINPRQPSVIERLEAKEALRLAALEKRRAEATEQRDPRESETAFLERFKQGAKGIEDRLAAILQQAKSASGVAGNASAAVVSGSATIVSGNAANAGNSSGVGAGNVAGNVAGTPPGNAAGSNGLDAQGGLREQLDGAASCLQELEKDVAACSYFLSPYHSRSVQASLGQLRDALACARSDALPKKKFAFTRKGRGGGGGEDTPAESPKPPPQQGTGPDMPSGLPAGTSAVSTSAPSGTALAAQPLTASSVPASAQPAAPLSSSAAFTTSAATTTTAATAPATTGAVVAAAASGRGFEGRTGETILLELNPSERGEVSLTNLRRCEVYLRGSAGAMFIHGLEDCRVHCGPVAGAVHVDGVTGCVFMLASHQLRIHHAQRTDFYIRVRSTPIVEYVSGVRFAPYNYTYEGLDKHLASTDLLEETGLWQKVDDFRWLRAVASPNWSVLPEAERVPAVDGTSVVPSQPAGDAK